MDFVRRWSEKAEIGVGRFIPWLGVTTSKLREERSGQPPRRRIAGEVDRCRFADDAARIFERTVVVRRRIRSAVVTN